MRIDYTVYLTQGDSYRLRLYNTDGEPPLTGNKFTDEICGRAVEALERTRGGEIEDNEYFKISFSLDNADCNAMCASTKRKRHAVPFVGNIVKKGCRK